MLSYELVIKALKREIRKENAFNIVYTAFTVVERQWLYTNMGHLMELSFQYPESTTVNRAITNRASTPQSQKPNENMHYK